MKMFNGCEIEAVVLFRPAVVFFGAAIVLFGAAVVLFHPIAQCFKLIFIYFLHGRALRSRVASSFLTRDQA